MPKFSSPLLQQMFNNKLKKGPGSQSGSEGGSPPQQHSPTEGRSPPQQNSPTDFKEPPSETTAETPQSVRTVFLVKRCCLYELCISLCTERT